MQTENPLPTDDDTAPSQHQRWPVRPGPAKRRIAAGRTPHLVDLENLMGGPAAGFLAMARAAAAYHTAVTVGDEDHVVVTVNPGLALDAHDVFPSALLRVRGGPDGADPALLELIADEAFVRFRYGRLVLGSGDAIFTAALARLRACGLVVGVVSRRHCLSAALRRSASFVRLLPDASLPEIAA